MDKITETMGKWLIEDLMTVGYNRMSQKDKNFLVQYLAESNGLAYTDITMEFIAHEQRKLKKEELKKRCEGEVLRGFESPNGNFYRTNRDDQVNMIGQKDLLNTNGAIETVMWKTENAGYLPHTKDEWIDNVFLYGIRHRSSLLFKYDYLKNLVESTAGEEGLISIDWDRTPIHNPYIDSTGLEDDGSSIPADETLLNEED